MKTWPQPQPCQFIGVLYAHACIWLDPNTEIEAFMSLRYLLSDGGWAITVDVHPSATGDTTTMLGVQRLTLVFTPELFRERKLLKRWDGTWTRVESQRMSAQKSWNPLSHCLICFTANWFHADVNKNMSSSRCTTFTILPPRVYPRAFAEQIRRLFPKLVGNGEGKPRVQPADGALAFSRYPWSDWPEASLMETVRYLRGSRSLNPPQKWKNVFPRSFEILHAMETKVNN